MPSQRTTVGGKEYEPQDYRELLGATDFSDEQLELHFGLYEGYVKHTNKALSLLREGSLDPYAAAEVRRRLVWEYNGMRLHEIYFGGMRGGGRDLHENAALLDALEREYGSYDAWRDSFEETGRTRGIGWACLSYDPVQGRLVNGWINEHDRGVMGDTEPIVLMDLWEHAFLKDFGTDRGAYMDAFFNAVDWDVCEQRFQQAREQGGTPRRELRGKHA